MIRKVSMAATVALIALLSSVGLGTAEAHGWGGHGGYGWHGGWGHGWHAGWGHYWPGYYGYNPYYAPNCYLTVYGTTYCY
jgi:hypothetical protein